MMCTVRRNGATRWLAICLVSALIIFLDLTPDTIAGSQTSEIVLPNAVIETDPNLILGFPAVVKVRLTGPVYVPDLSIRTSFANLAAVLVSQSDGSTITIQSVGPESRLVVQSHGGIAHPKPRWTLIPEGEKRDMIFDLCYLKVRGSAFPQLREVPPGKYSLYLRFGQSEVDPRDLKEDLHASRVRLSGMHTNAVTVTLIEPSEKDKEFLRRIRKEHILIPWSRALWMEFPAVELDSVSPMARRQMGFHLFLSQVVASKTPVDELPVDKLRAIPVSKHLEPEKRGVLLEIEKATGKTEVDKRISDFLNDYPGQRWRFKDLGRGGYFSRGFLRIR